VKVRIPINITYEELVKFKQENPEVTRTDINSSNFRVAKRLRDLGWLDELFPSKYFNSNDLTLEDCQKFKQEHPDMKRNTISSKHSRYMKAMKRLGVWDELYPQRLAHHARYTDEELLEIASKYDTVRDMKENDGLALTVIYHRGEEFKKKALAHMKPLGDRRNRMIYAFEFPDNYAYVGLTYDANMRRSNHMRDNKNSAVKRHIKETGLAPVWKALTDYVPVEDAKRLEGEYVEKYRNEGWKILNVEATGGIGSTPTKINYEEVLKLVKQGFSVREIAERLGGSISTVGHFLTSQGIKLEHPNSRIVELIDENGNVEMVFPSVRAAARYIGVHEANLRNNIKKGWKTHGHMVRYKEHQK